MSKIKGTYETIFITKMTGGEEKTKEIVEKFKTLIEKNATDIKVEEWGKRRLAYPIQDLTEGYYTLINFTSDPSFPAELDRIYNITDGLLRSMIITKD